MNEAKKLYEKRVLGKRITRNSNNSNSSTNSNSNSNTNTNSNSNSNNSNNNINNTNIRNNEGYKNFMTSELEKLKNDERFENYHITAKKELLAKLWRMMKLEKESKKKNAAIGSSKGNNYNKFAIKIKTLHPNATNSLIEKMWDGVKLRKGLIKKDIRKKMVVYSKNLNKSRKEADWIKFSRKLVNSGKSYYGTITKNTNPKTKKNIQNSVKKRKININENVFNGTFIKHKGKEVVSSTSTTNKILLENTFKKNKNIINFKTFNSAYYIKVDKNNYKKFILSIDHENQDDRRFTKLVDLGCPVDNNLARLYDNGQVFLKQHNFEKFIRKNYKIWDSIKNKNYRITESEIYPRYIINFSPIIFRIKFSNKFIWVIYNYSNASNVEKRKVSIEIMKDEYRNQIITKNGTLTTGMFKHQRTKKELRELIKRQISKIIKNDDTDQFFKFLTEDLKLLDIDDNFYYGKNGKDVFTVDLDDPELFRSFYNDIIHDDFKFLRNKNYYNEEQLFYKLWDEFNLGDVYSGWKLDSGYPTKKTTSNHIFLMPTRENIETKRRSGVEVVNPNSPVSAKTLGDIGQIVYCIINKKIFASGDSSAVNIAISIAKSSKNPLNILYDSNDDNYIFLSVNKTENIKINLKPQIQGIIVNNFKANKIENITQTKIMECSHNVNKVYCRYLKPQIERERLLMKALSKVSRPNGVNNDMANQIIEQLSQGKNMNTIGKIINLNNQNVKNYIKRLYMVREKIFKPIINHNAGQGNTASTSGTRRNN